MKLKKIAFLFFCALLLVQAIYSQEKIDSPEHYKNLMLRPKSTSDLITAYTYFKKSKEVSLSKKQIINAIYYIGFISKIEYDLGAYLDSEKSAVEGLKLFDSFPDNDRYVIYITPILNLLGKLKREFNEYDKSIEYYQKILVLSSNNHEKGVTHNNLGVVYLYDKEFKQALIEFQKAYRLNKKTKNNIEIIRSLDNLGFVQSKLDIKEGLSNMLKALTVRKKNSSPNIFTSYKHLTEYYIDKSNKKEALFYANKALYFAKKMNNSSMLEEALSNLILLKEDHFAFEYRNVVRSLKEKRQTVNNLFAEARYNYTKAELRTLKSEAKANRNLFIAISILLIALFVFYTLRIQYRKGKLKERYDTERHISKKLHDEVANDVFSMMSRLQKDPTTKKEVIDNLEEVYLKTRDISKANAAINVSKDFDVLLKDLTASYKTDVVNIFTRNVSEISWDTITDLKKETLYRVLQELMTNMSKHSKATLVSVQFEEKNNKIVVQYVDNGVGCELKHGTGLRNTENRMELAGGSIIFESETNKGFQAKLII